MKDFFQGLQVIELASVLAGPAVGMFFSELGADVLKVENKKTGGDVTRNWKLPTENKSRDYSAYFSAVNYHKKHIFLDIAHSGDYAALEELIQSADVVISNFRDEQALKLKVDYPTLSTINPRLIFANLTGFGRENPRPAFDVVLQAETGYLSMSGQPGQPPAKMPVALIDLLAAHQMKEGILMALLQRARTGKGCMVETSLFQSAVASLANQASNWLMEQHIAQPMGTQHPNIAPYGDIYHSKDGKALVLSVGTERQFAALCQTLGLTLQQDPRFANNTLRVFHRKELDEALRPAIAQQDTNELEAAFLQMGVPYGRIRNMEEVFQMPMAQELVREEIMPDGGISKRVSSIAFSLSTPK